MATGLSRVLDHLQQAGGGLSDGQLLGRFVGSRDEAAFAALVRRHGPMVLGVCRRVLGDHHDAEDAFQAAFLVLARKAGSVVRRESLGCWLYQVAYHTALEAGAARARRRARERPMAEMPHPETPPAEAQDWRPILDREISRLSEKYRAAIVLCDLEGRTRTEAARLLKVPEGTLSSRLAAGRRALAKRLAGCGFALSAGALAAALAEGSASAQVTAGLASGTAKAAALVAAGEAAALSAPAAVLMKGVMRAMLVKRLRLLVGAVVVLAALGLVGLGYREGGGPGAARAAPPEKPRDELEALRKENELLKLNLLVVLEKVRAQETEIHDLRTRPAGGGGFGGMAGGMMSLGGGAPGMGGMPPMGGGFPGAGGGPPIPGGAAPGAGLPKGGMGPPAGRAEPDPVKEAEAAVKALREAKDPEGKRRAADSLEKAMKKLREQLK